MQKLFLLLSFLLVCIKAEAQTNLYVDASVLSSGAGTTWATAYKTLNEALNVANAGSAATKYDIHIAAGNYYPTGVQSGTNRDSTFLIARTGIRLYGGYSAGGGGPRSTSNYTVLSGDIDSAGITSDNSYHVLVVAGIAATTDTVFMDKLFIGDGNADGSLSKTYNNIPLSQGAAGGMMIRNIACRLQIDSCYFYYNLSSGLAGAILNENARSIFTNCTFQQNIAAGSGGALYINSDSNTAPVIISYCAFFRNSATNASGGAIYNTRSGGVGAGTVVSNCLFGYPAFLFNRNTAGMQGGAICDNSQNCAAASITDCSFYGNAAPYGGAIAGNNTTVSAGSNYIKNCIFSVNTASVWGGAISNNASNFSFTIDSCSFDGNKAGIAGGGLYTVSTGTAGVSTVSRCIFNRDSAASGGGIYNSGAVNFYSTRFTLNKAAQGAGLYNLSPGNSIVRNDTFSGNLAAQAGAGLYNKNSGSGYTISNSLFSGNKAGSGGGGIYDSLASPSITNCTFAGDTAGAGNGIYNNASSPVILNSIIWEGSNGIFNANSSIPTVTYSTVQGGYAGAGNLSSNPLFIAPAPAGLAPTTTGNYDLIPCSPQVDAGINTGSYSGVFDLAGRARLYGSRVDQGAYEYSGAAFPTPVTGADSVCTSSSITLSNITAGGTWTSSNPLIATVNASGLVTGVSPGIDTIIYSLTSGSCSGSAMKVIGVKLGPVVAPITGKDTLCPNGSVLLSNATSGGSWTSSNNLIATTSHVFGSGLILGQSPGTVAITYTVSAANGCATSVTKNLTVVAPPPTPIINGKTSICRHDLDSFSSTTAGGVWSSDDTNIAGIDPTSGVAVGLAKGRAGILYTVSNAYCSSSSFPRPLTVEVLDTTVTIFFSGMLFAELRFASYQWIDCANGYSPIAGDTSAIFYPPGNGQYAVILSKSGCTDTSACIPITGLGISGMNEPDWIKVYPNPVSDLVTIATGKIVPEYIIVRDIAGKQLQRLVPVTSMSTISLASYTPGIYLIETYDGMNRYTGRLSVVR